MPGRRSLRRPGLLQHDSRKVVLCSYEPVNYEPAPLRAGQQA